MAILKFRKGNYISLKGSRAQETAVNVPDDLFMKCPACGETLYRPDVVEHAYCCGKCGKYFRLGARNRLRMVLDKGSFQAWDEGIRERNPLQDAAYGEKLDSLKGNSGLDEAVITGVGTIGGIRCVIAVWDTRFLMGSMGTVAGEKLTRAFERAQRERLPIVVFACSGGARMQEGLASLMQMAKTSAAVKRHSEAGLLYISVLTDPTTGGVTASFAMLGDIILAEPGALIGFAGPRVIEQTTGQKLPEGFQRAEFLLEHGFVDNIVERPQLKATLHQLLQMHGYPENSESANNPTADKAATHADRKVDVEGMAFGQKKTEQREAVPWERAEAEGKRDFKRRQEKWEACQRETEQRIQWEKAAADEVWESSNDFFPEKKSAWERVKLSRRKDRLTALDYINGIFADFTELHGDRGCRDDAAIVGGIGFFNGRPVTVIGVQKGKNTKENLCRNFGMPSPEGYRKALRLMQQAEKFGRPIVTFVDTPGAACGMEAEERGQGEAIARNLLEMSALRVPVLAIMIGEGGSGGALALAVANEVWMLENAAYSVLSPEGFASILWKDSRRSAEAAEQMRMGAAELKEMGFVEKIIPEYGQAQEKTREPICAFLKKELELFCQRYEQLSPAMLPVQRYERFRKM